MNERLETLTEATFNLTERVADLERHVLKIGIAVVLCLGATYFILDKREH